MTRWQFGWLNQRIQNLVHGLVQAQRWHWLLLLVWLLPLLLVGFFDLDHQSLMAHDEGLYARRARVIVDSGDWIHPWANPHHKTPGPYWVVALFMQLLGRHEVAVRLPSILASIGCIWLTYAIGKRLMTPTAALLGALSLGVAPLWLQYSRLATPDVMFTGLVLLAVGLLLEANTEPPLNPGRRHWLHFAAGCTLGIMVLMRSALAVVPVLCLLPYFLLSGRRHLWQWSLYLGGLVGLLPTALWLWRCWQRYDMAVINALINFPVSQSLTTARVKSPLFYLLNLLVNDFLWALFALGALFLLLRGVWSSRGRWLARPQISLLLGYPLCYLGILSFASTKLPHYAIPIYPFLALLTGYAMEELVHIPPRGAVKVSLKLVNGVLMVAGAVLTCAAVLALFTPVLPSTADIRPYAPIALGLGLAWLGAGLWWFQGNSSSAAVVTWLLLLLVGHWVGLSLAWGTAELGNVNPEMKALLIRDDIQPILQTETINLSPGLNSKRSTLLRFYTPNPGEKLLDLGYVGANDYLWIEAPELDSLPFPYESLGQIKQTHLVHMQSQ
ncbi:ArnT family glycosyltransferase [Leptothoe kymatousa]|uniref:Glycosyltransferase family 39 protein n=1 Tax=Leptothoe kymatousa TAU-MAC 1615 TaxID=2364775 RepID=A0ABS5Y0Q7_9CYAN|nr:glycosyltransferase family 39 protein [Leptothoe kymatousa]MBT9311393.1 glycosyltransferase family 39 protein [Leptothoe kymatousa TAU-MAC 1615]